MQTSLRSMFFNLVLSSLTAAAVEQGLAQPRLDGIVLKPSGEVAADVVVYLTDNQGCVYAGERLKVREPLQPGVQKTRTDNAGKFSFRLTATEHSIVILDPTGNFEAQLQDLGKEHVVRLHAWASIEGKLMIGRHPGAHEKVGLRNLALPYAEYPREFPALSFTAKTQTDADGKFSFEKVPASAIEVHHIVGDDNLDDPYVRYVRSQIVNVIPREGSTTQIILGGSGGPVAGRMILTGFDGTFDWRQELQSIEWIPQLPGDLQELVELFRKHEKALSEAATEKAKQDLQQGLQNERPKIREKIRRFYASDAGREYIPRRSYAVSFSRGGAFKAEDVPDGNYSLDFFLHEKSPIRGVPWSQFARLNKQVEVRHQNGSAQLCDLGAFTITITANSALPLGAVSPDFEVKDLHGKTVRLSDFKGKFVLLEFWSVSCPPCVEEARYLRKVYDAFKDNNRFAMIGLSFDESTDNSRKFVADNFMEWTQGFLGEWPPGPVGIRFKVSGPPSIYLIDPDGIIVASRLRDFDIMRAVRAALQEK